MIIIVVECESCGQTFGIRPQDVRDRRIVHCIHCGKLVVMPKEDVGARVVYESAQSQIQLGYKVCL